MLHFVAWIDQLYVVLFNTFNCVNLSQIIYEVNNWFLLQLISKILIRNTHNPQGMTEYRVQGLFLNLKLDPSLVCLKELQRNKLTTSCTEFVKKIHFTCVQFSFTEKRKEENYIPFFSIYCAEAYIVQNITQLNNPNYTVLLLK